jgi:3-deoxy-7-phosphoheptulonate synthase
MMTFANQLKLLKPTSSVFRAFTYQEQVFSQDSFTVFAGLCAVDNRDSVEKTMQCLSKLGLTCTRMGAYKPRTTPYQFQGHGASCLPYVFELAGKYGIKIIAMEVTHDRQIAEIQEALALTGHPTGVMLQIGTRNAQNYELLSSVGRQTEFPVLYKRGYGITLEESLLAAEYIAKAGNQNIVFCLRGVKTLLGNPHRNLVDFAHLPIVKRHSNMPVCIDPSHSVGNLLSAPDTILDISHIAASGVIMGANMILLDVHPDPAHACVDSEQALSLDSLPCFIEDMMLVRETYLKRVQLTQSRPKNHVQAHQKTWV